MTCPCCACVADTCVCKTLDEYIQGYGGSDGVFLICERDSAGRTPAPTSALLTLSGFGSPRNSPPCPFGGTPYSDSIPSVGLSNATLNGSYLLQSRVIEYGNGKSGPPCIPGGAIFEFSGVFSIADDRYQDAQWEITCRAFAGGGVTNEYAAIIRLMPSGQEQVLVLFGGTGIGQNNGNFVPTLSLAMCAGSSIQKAATDCVPSSAELEIVGLP